MTLNRPCAGCGEPGPETYCRDCRPPEAPKARSSTERGYDTQHQKLSRRARKLQPWCTGCGATEDLQLDHSPETWQRRAEGKPLRLTDYRGVYCGDCNRKNGAAKPAATRGDTPLGVGSDPGPAGGKSVTHGNHCQ